MKHKAFYTTFIIFNNIWTVVHYISAGAIALLRQQSWWILKDYTFVGATISHIYWIWLCWAAHFTNTYMFNQIQRVSNIYEVFLLSFNKKHMKNSRKKAVYTAKLIRCLIEKHKVLLSSNSFIEVVHNDVLAAIGSNRCFEVQIDSLQLDTLRLNI